MRMFTLAACAFMALTAAGEPQLAFAAGPAIITPEANKAFLTGVVAKNALDYAKLEVVGGSNIGAGADAYGGFVILNVYSQQLPLGGTTRSELAIDYPFREGETVRYSWRMKIPTNFAADPNNRWWLLARWNDQANVKFGEKPEDMLSHNPPIMLNYRQMEGKDILSLSYGLPESMQAGSFRIFRGEWVKLSMEVTWSRGESGKAKLFVNDGKQPMFTVTGKNMYGKYQHVFRTGINRSNEIRGTTYIQIGGISIEHVNN